MKTFFKFKSTRILFVLTFSFFFCAFVFVKVQGDPVITLDFDSYNDHGKQVILEAEYADSSKMPFAEAETILKEKRKCEIIFSEDDGDCSHHSMGGHKKWGFFN